MADNIEIDDRVDLDDDNYTEEDDDVEEQMEDEGVGEHEDHADDHHEDLRSEDSGKEHLLAGDANEADVEHLENVEISNASTNALDKDKHAELLDCPPHGSEVFIGGLPRDVTEEDLGDLCESLGEIFEVS